MAVAKGASRAIIRRRPGRSRRLAKKRGTTSAPTSLLSSAGSNRTEVSGGKDFRQDRAAKEEQPGEAEMMRATRTRTTGRRSRPVKHAAKRRMAKLSKPARPVRVAVAPPEPVLYKLCKPGWAVIVERIPNAQGTRFVCPFCPKSHRVPGPVRGFKKVRRAQWSRLRRVEE